MLQETGVPWRNRKEIANPSDKSIKSIKSKLSAIFQARSGDNVAKLIKQVNPIRGYCESKRTRNFSKAARHINSHLFILQMRWIRRAHPNKSTGWVVRKYFIHLVIKYINNKWAFRCPSTGLICIQTYWYANKRNWPPVISKYSPDDPDPIVRES